MEEEINNGLVSTYPNPVNDQLHITASVDGELRFILFDPEGKMLQTKTFSGATAISLENLAPGIYFYEVLGENGLLNKGKVVRQ